MPIYLNKILKELSKKTGHFEIEIPGIWINHHSSKSQTVDYASYVSLCIEKILKNGPNTKTKDKDWTKQALIYNIFVRFFTAYDHDQDGIIGNIQDDITLNKQGVRETGTLLKTIIMLPYLKSLGVNTIHLLPITAIGKEGRKGDMGSPYAIKNPFEIDPNIADPIVDMSVEEQYKALIEAAHLLGMYVVQEFIFRTSAIDADWTNNHPEWFYWIKDRKDYGPPSFTPGELAQIMKVPKNKGRFIPPTKSYRRQFIVPTPGIAYKNLQIASAFADWPPNDLQPPWSDVTYLRLYNYDFEKENNYNYIAYNTIRYYDPELARPEHINEPLWEKITDIIPYYQQNFGIDGAMIDMGHALPDQLKSRIIKKARINDPHFAFWDENFSNKVETKQEGYNAVIGDCWYKITKRQGFMKIIKSIGEDPPLPFFGAAETHNSPRFGHGNLYKKEAAWLLFNILPHAVPFIHNGFELHELLPVNTGLNFTKAQIDVLATKRLPLFYKSSMDWDTPKNIVSFIQKIANIRTNHPWIFEHKNISLLKTDNDKVLGFLILSDNKSAVALFNTNFDKSEDFSLNQDDSGVYSELITDKHIEVGEKNKMVKGEVILGLREMA